MSDTIDAAAPTSTETAGQRVLTSAADAPAYHFHPRDLTRLAQGFYFTFWGILAALCTVAEALGAPTLRTYALTVGSLGVLGMLAGSWRLYQTRDLGRDWKNVTLALLVIAVLIVYLFPFFCMWRVVPTNLYLFCHALAWAGLLIGHMSLLSVAVGALARLAGRPSLAVQAVLYGSASFIVLSAPFAILAYPLIAATRRGGDPLAAVVFLLGRLHLAYVVIALIPVALTLSLAWTAKDFVLRRLSAQDPQHILDPNPHE